LTHEPIILEERKMPPLIVLSTCSNPDEARKIAYDLLEKRLAACVNITPVNSLFIWKEAIEESKEQLMIIKTSSELFDELERHIKSVHSYEVPEVVGIQIERGSKPYLDWLQTSLQKSV